ncbi:MAG TPA: glycosyltransferase family 4 protein [Longimicrobium sp.]|jgi:glycosyltransferase involved in cell wall biosynthesis|uniref:glycosyltransferase family 4 protein n=1 Tax=Longimicrobium sp. TaxID=2029185 RepID=UPI002ED80895
MNWVVVFNGARDGYQVPLGLAGEGRLEALVTDWYSPLDRRWAAALPARARAVLGRRYAPGLPSSRVVSLWGQAVRQAAGLGTLDQVDARLGARAGALARRRGAGILAYSYYAHAAFGAYGRGGAPRLLFQVHPHPASLRSLFQDEMKRVPAAGSLAGEEEMRAGGERFQRLAGEPRMADLCLVASRYTGRTLVENGVAPEAVRVIPYGVDTAFLHPAPERRPGPFRVLFAGQMVQRKGLSDLLEAWRGLGLAHAELTLVGRGRFDEGVLRAYEGCFRMETDASRTRLRELYQQADVLCVPSLAEGFGLVYLEAMACGTPVIATHNTGAADLVTDGRDGWVVPIRAPEAIAERLRWCHENRDALARMRPAVRATAERYTWPAFRASVARATREAGERPGPVSADAVRP